MAAYRTSIAGPSQLASGHHSYLRRRSHGARLYDNQPNPIQPNPSPARKANEESQQRQPAATADNPRSRRNVLAYPANAYQTNTWSMANTTHRPTHPFAHSLLSRPKKRRRRNKEKKKKRKKATELFACIMRQPHLLASAIAPILQGRRVRTRARAGGPGYIPDTSKYPADVLLHSERSWQTNPY